MLRENIPANSQKNGIITLFHKNGDKSVLGNWRPITLLCVDYKIFTKIIVNRIKPLLVKFISPEQFCSVSGRNILNCNIILRDLLNYATENNEQMAIISLDFKQAFDRVNIDFVFKTMDVVGFSNNFINCIRCLYTNITSKLKINNELGNQFLIKRGVRQGCPLSMILFIIYQETLYRLIKMNSLIKPILLPNFSKFKLLGYADDSNVFIKSENDLPILFNILKIFGSATGAEINTNKTKIMGFGSWKGKTNWNANWLVPESHSIKCLGIYYFNNWNDTVNKNWQLVEEKIDTCLRFMKLRKLTIFQKGVLVNSCVISKLIYVASIIPIPIKVAKNITQMIFKYLWNGRYDPIRRDALYLPKECGGIGLKNVMIKCNSALLKTFIKIYSDDETVLGIGLMIYYCDFRLSSIIPKNAVDLTYNIPSYYMHTLDLSRNIMHIKKFQMLHLKKYMLL